MAMRWCAASIVEAQATFAASVAASAAALAPR